MKQKVVFNIYSHITSQVLLLGVEKGEEDERTHLKSKGGLD